MKKEQFSCKKKRLFQHELGKNVFAMYLLSFGPNSQLLGIIACSFLKSYEKKFNI